VEIPEGIGGHSPPYKILDKPTSFGRGGKITGHLGRILKYETVAKVLGGDGERSFTKTPRPFPRDFHQGSQVFLKRAG
jgi:hypothetical protein